MLPQLHFDNSYIASGTVRDIIIGTADGLTVPFVLASGVSGAIDSAHIVVTAGLAQVVAGALAMGLSGYLAARDEAERYQREFSREDRPVIKTPGKVATALHRKPKDCRKFILRFKHGLRAPDPKRPLRSALTISCSYVLCGMIPLLPYMIVNDLHQALLISIFVTLLALAVFGFVKGHLTGISRFRCAWQTAMIGSLAAGIAFSLAKVIS